jgi:hypothetical protein
VVIGVGLVCLVAGFLAGSRLDVPTDPVASEEPATPLPPVAAGAVSKVTDPLDDGGFRIPLFNSGEEEVTSTVVALPGWAPALTRSAPVTIGPRSWGVASFAAPADCATDPVDLRGVRVKVQNSDGVTHRLALLPEPAWVLLEHHRAVCSQGEGSP